MRAPPSAPGTAPGRGPRPCRRGGKRGAALRGALQVARDATEQGFISRAALDSARARLQATRAQLAAQQAQASAGHTQTGYFVLKAPYAGVVAEVPVMLGDMALPGWPLLTLYDPQALRVSVAVPAATAAALATATGADAVRIQFPGLGASEWLTPLRVTPLPTLDPATHNRQLRLDLPPPAAGHGAIAPGLFARVWLSAATSPGTRLEVPARAVVRRGELTGLYGVGADGRALLRQVCVWARPRVTGWKCSAAWPRANW